MGQPKHASLKIQWQGQHSPLLSLSDEWNSDSTSAGLNSAATHVQMLLPCGRSGLQARESPEADWVARQTVQQQWTHELLLLGEAASCTVALRPYGVGGVSYRLSINELPHLRHGQRLRLRQVSLGPHRRLGPRAGAGSQQPSPFSCG